MSGGLNNARKSRQVFRWLHEGRFQVIFLQEVYSSRNLERVWSAEWGGKVVYSHGSKHSSGTLVLFNPSLDVEVENHETDQRGRLIILRANNEYQRIQVYFYQCLCAERSKMKFEFFETLKLRLRKYADDNIILGGDLNCCLTPEDKQGGRPTEQKQQLIDSILNLCNSFNLVDLWRKLHPNESLFTWHQNSSAIRCWLDYWLVSKHLLPQVKECNITPVSFSDHSAVSFNIQSDDFIKRGPGFSKFNNSPLDDHCFVEGLRKKIPEYKEKYSYLRDKRLYWDMLKMEIRSFTICYCKQIAKNKKNEEAVLQQQFSSLHKLMCASPGQETVTKFHAVKLISIHKTKGAMIRSKARWCEQGERSTRYFFNLEKRNRSNNYITKLKAENRTLVIPTEIINEEYRYYQNLYTSTCTNPNDTCFDEFFESPTLPKLTSQLADTCDGFLTKEECHASLKEFFRVSLLAQTA